MKVLGVYSNKEFANHLTNTVLSVNVKELFDEIDTYWESHSDELVIGYTMEVYYKLYMIFFASIEILGENNIIYNIIINDENMSRIYMQKLKIKYDSPDEFKLTITRDIKLLTTCVRMLQDTLGDNVDSSHIESHTSNKIVKDQKETPKKKLTVVKGGKE